MRELKDGDILFSVPSDRPRLVTFGFDCYTFLRFCANHAKPFGFLWRYESICCPKCGERFKPDSLRSFEMIKTGYTITQSFRNGVEVSRARQSKVNDVLDAEYLDA